MLNVIGETEKKCIKLGDIIGPLEEGTPGMLSLGDHRCIAILRHLLIFCLVEVGVRPVVFLTHDSLLELCLKYLRLSGQSMITYLNYGPFASFAPQYDSTWATLTKSDSDLLLRCAYLLWRGLVIIIQY